MPLRLPLATLPIALFVTLMQGVGHFFLIYGLSLIFGLAISLSLWVVRWKIYGGDKRDLASMHRGAMIRRLFTYFGSSILAFLLTGLALQATLLPQIFGGTRGMLMSVSFAVIFTVLAMGVTMAMQFYSQAVDRVRVEEELNTARMIQRAFLRSSFETPAPFDVHALNVSSKHVSGDFYDVVSSAHGQLLLAIADVSGKGVPAALQGALLQSSLRTQARTGGSVAPMLVTMNALLHESITPGQFATFFLASIDAATLRLSYANAGHNPPLLVRAHGEHEWLEDGGLVLGAFSFAHYEPSYVQLAPGDWLLLFTDGVTEAAVGDAMYGEERLLQTVLAAVARGVASAAALNAVVLADVRDYLAGTEAGDDITLVALHVSDTVDARLIASLPPMDATP